MLATVFFFSVVNYFMLTLFIPAQKRVASLVFAQKQAKKEGNKHVRDERGKREIPLLVGMRKEP